MQHESLRRRNSEWLMPGLYDRSLVILVTVPTERRLINILAFQ